MGNYRGPYVIADDAKPVLFVVQFRGRGYFKTKWCGFSYGVGFDIVRYFGIFATI